MTPHTSDLDRIMSVLYVFFSNPSYRPRDYTLADELNPTRDKAKARILQLDQVVDWRLRVYGSFRCNLGRDETCNQMAWYHQRHITMPHMCQKIYRHEQVYWRRYLSRGECWAWWKWYWDEAESPELGSAVKKITRNFDRMGVGIDE